MRTLTLPGKPGIKWVGKDAKGRPFRFDPQNPKHLQYVTGKINEFCRAPVEIRQQVLARVQELTTKDATPDLFNNINVADVIQTDVGDIDLGWQQAFDLIDLRDTQESSFEVLDVSSGLTFSKVKPGENAKIYRVSGSKVTVSIDRYGGGLGFDLDWWMDSKFYHVEQAVADFRFKHYDEMAQVFFALITAVTTAGTFDTDDMTTINNAVAAILNASHKVLPVSPSSTFLLYYNPTLEKRVFKALNQVVAYTAQKELRYRVIPVMSLYVTDTTHTWLVLPGRKNKWGNRMDLTVLEQTNIHNWTHDAVGWSRYGAHLNSAQVRRLNLS